MFAGVEITRVVPRMAPGQVAMLSPGAVVAGYRIERVLGIGGMGVVYLVANPELPRRDALKVLNSELSRDPDFRARFIREADVSSMLDHPNIVSIYRRGTTEDDQLWIAMKFVDGTDADAALRARQMTPARAVHIITEVAKALDYAHENNVVHRDVKPANFLLSGPVGPRERVLLGDFGIARALDEASITVTGSVTATLAYAAPEVLSGGQVDGRSDIYSLGCALFRLLTGKAPYHDAAGPAAIMSAHIQQPPPRITEAAPGLPPALDAVLATAMAKDPAQRYRSAADFAAAAAECARRTHHPRTAPAYPSTGGGQYPARRQRPGRLPAPPPSGPWPPAGYPQYPPPPAPRRNNRLVGILAAAAVLIAAVATGAVVLSNRGDDAGPTPTPSASGSSTASSTTSPSATSVDPDHDDTGGAGGPPVAASALPGLLLGTDELANLAGAAGLVVTQSAQVLSDDSPVVDAKDCVGAWVPAQRAVYGDSGWSAAQQQLSAQRRRRPADRTPSRRWSCPIPAPRPPNKSVEQQSTQWAACAGRVITGSIPHPPTTVRYTFGSPVTTDGVVSLRETREGGNGWGCERAITARNNVVVDVMVCRYDPTNQATAAVNAIAARIPLAGSGPVATGDPVCWTTPTTTRDTAPRHNRRWPTPRSDGWR